MSKIVALIPARSGSVRVKHKNLRQFDGIPLLGLAVRQALLAENVDEVYISTDNPMQFTNCLGWGVVLLRLRPKKTGLQSGLANDFPGMDFMMGWAIRRNNLVM